MADEDYVTFVCVKEGSKLRVRITSPGYHPEANCQFPRAMRQEGRVFRAPRRAVSFAEGARGTLFYKVAKKAIEEVVDLDDVRVFDVDEDNLECVVCMSENKSTVFIPCGHYCCCLDCSTQIQGGQGACPICRTHISRLIDHSEIS